MVACIIALASVLLCLPVSTTFGHFPECTWDDLNMSNSVHSSNTSLTSSLDSVEVRWELVGDRSSLSGRIDEKNGLAINPDNDIMSVMLNGPAAGSVTDLAIIEWLRERCSKRGKTSYLLYVRHDDTDLIKLTCDHPEVVSDLMPLLTEYNAMTAHEREIVRRWVRQFVGQWNPRIRFVVDNTKGERQVNIISVQYNVEKLSVFKAELPFPEFKEFSFDLAYKKGMQEFKLLSQHGEIEVSPGKSSTFDIVLRPGPDAPASPVWDGFVSLKTNLGTIKVGKLSLRTFNPHKGGAKDKRR